MQFSNFSRVKDGLTITLYNEIPIENVKSITFYRDNATGTFSKKEFRWSFNNEYWSSWQTLTQKAFSSINTNNNYYLFLQIRYILNNSDSGDVTLFSVTYKEGDLFSSTPRILTEDIQHLDSSAVLIHDILQKEKIIEITDASTLAGYPASWYLDRSHHRGQQSISTIFGLQDKLNELTFLKELTNKIEVVFNGNDLEIAVGTKEYRQVNSDYVISGWTILSDVSGNITIDIKITSYDNWPEAISITGSEKPFLLNQNKNSSNTISTWDTMINSNDIIEFIVEDVSLIKKAWLFLDLNLK